MKKTGLILGVILLIGAFLRLYRIHTVPVSLFGDELDVGYHAYSILKTGKDYMGNPWPLEFESLAEFRTPLFLYSSVPAIALFGITPFGVRITPALFGIAGVYSLYLFVRTFLLYHGEKEKKAVTIALFSAALLALSPWHIQYSRAAFEVTQLLTALLLGLHFFYASLTESRKGKHLWLSTLFLGLTPWMYNSAKLFTPLLLLALLVIHYKELLSFKKAHSIKAVSALLIVGLPMAYSIFFGGGAQRFGFLSLFANPAIETEVGTSRMLSARMRGDVSVGASPLFFERVLYNKYTYVGKEVVNNMLMPFSSEFLFVSGDANLRHSIYGMGQLYKATVIPLGVGLVAFFSQKKKGKVQWLLGVWLVAVAVTSSITRDGGTHATRLITMLPPLMFLSGYGIYTLLQTKVWGKWLGVGIAGLFIVNFLFYQQQYWVHNPWYSERWWHAGWREALIAVKEHEADFDKVMISDSHEPPWIFFSAWYPYPPAEWQAHHPFDNTIDIPGFGEMPYIGKYYFGTPEAEEGGQVSMYEWPALITPDILYLANASEVGPNLITDPGAVPGDLELIETIAFPSGEPAFYLFTRR